MSHDRSVRRRLAYWTVVVVIPCAVAVVAALTSGLMRSDFVLWIIVVLALSSVIMAAVRAERRLKEKPRKAGTEDEGATRGS